MSRRRRSAVPPCSRREMPKPVNSEVPNEGQQPRVGRLGRRHERLRAERESCSKTPPMDGRSRSSVPIPTATMSGNAAAPRATGGQTTPARAMAIGSSIVAPDQEVERAARPVGDQDGDGRDGPGDDEAAADQSQLEPTDAHGPRV